MLLANPHFSHIYSYIEAINKIKNASFNCAYKSDEVTKGDTIYFRCFDLESTIQLNPESLFASGIIVKDARYSGTLSFSYNKTTKQIFIDTVPYVICGATKVPLFTSDIARIVREKIGRIAPIETTKIVFKDPFLILTEDKRAAEVLPGIKSTSNHAYFNHMIAEIEREKGIIADDIAKCKRRDERRINEEENAFRRKRRIYGIDPEGISIEEFKRRLGEVQAKKYRAKLKGLEKNLVQATREYYHLYIDQLLPNNKERLFQYERYLIYIIIKKLALKGEIRSSDYLYDIADKYQSLNEEEYANLINELKKKTNSSIIELIEYLHNLREEKVEYNKGIIKEIIRVFHDYDMNDIIGWYYNEVVGYSILEEIDWDKPCLDADHTPKIKDRCRIFAQFFSNTDYCNGVEQIITPMKYHPLLSKGFFLIEKLRNKYSKNLKIYRTLTRYNKEQRYNSDTAKICFELKRKNVIFPELALMIRLARLEEKVARYRKLLEKSPIELAEKFLKRPVVWGQEKMGMMVQAPYFRELQFCNDRSYGVMMIKPGVEKLDFEQNSDDMVLDRCDGLITYIDSSEMPGIRSSKDSYILGYLHKSWQFRAINNFIIAVPDSLDNESIKCLYDYVFEAGGVIFVCQSMETAARVRKVIAFVAVNNLHGETYNENANVIVDPNYYGDFIKRTPKIRELWSEYSKKVVEPYDADYISRIEFLHAFCCNLSVTQINESSIVDMHYANRVFDELAFGGFTSKQSYAKEAADFDELLKDKSKRIRLISDFRYNIREAIRRQDCDEQIEDEY